MMGTIAMQVPSDAERVGVRCSWESSEVAIEVQHSPPPLLVLPSPGRVSTPPACPELREVIGVSWRSAARLCRPQVKQNRSSSGSAGAASSPPPYYEGSVFDAAAPPPYGGGAYSYDAPAPPAYAGGAFDAPAPPAYAGGAYDAPAEPSQSAYGVPATTPSMEEQTVQV